MATPATRTPIKLARGSYSNLYASIDDLQEGEIVYAEDQNQLYVKEGSQLIDVTGDGGGGGGSTNLSYTTSGAGLSLVSSSGSNTNLPAATTDAWGLMTDEDKTKLDGIAASANNYSISSDLLDEDDMASDSATKAPSQQSVKAYVTATGGATNLSNTANGTSLTIESSSGNNTSLPAATTSAWGVMTDEDKTNLDANTAKVTNATHTGDVTGATTLTIANDKIEEKHINAGGTPGADKVLVYDSGEDTNWKWADQSGSGSGTPEGTAVLSSGETGTAKFLRVDGDGSCSWQVPPDTTYSVQDGQLSQNNFTDDDHTKLNGIAIGANNYSHPNHSGDVTSSGDGATTIADLAVTNAKIADDTISEAKLDIHADPSGTDKVLGYTANGMEWVAQSGGGGGGGTPGGSNTQVQYNSSGSFAGSSNLTFDGTNLTVGGTATAVSPAVASAGLRKIFTSASSPQASDGAVGDIWLKF